VLFSSETKQRLIFMSKVPSVLNAMEGGYVNVLSCRQITPLSHLPLGSAQASFQIDYQHFDLDAYVGANGEPPVNIKNANSRERFRLVLVSSAGQSHVVCSFIMGGGAGKHGLLANGSDLKAGLAYGTAILPNPFEAIYDSIHAELSATLPVSCACHGSNVSLGPILPYGDAAAQNRGTRRAELIWPGTGGERVILTVIQVMVDTFNCFTRMGRRWDAGLAVAGQPHLQMLPQPLMLPSPSTRQPSLV
jgi:hypothetical protein